MNDEICVWEYVFLWLIFKVYMVLLDIKFNSEGMRVYVLFYGSWNRDELEGYKVVEVEWDVGMG